MSTIIEGTPQIATAAALDGIRLVSVAGKTHINRDYTAQCVTTWSRIRGIAGRYQLISDGLRESDVELATDLGFDVLPRHPEIVVEAMSARPALAKIREALPTWRHVIDSVIVFRDSPYILLIDTDVLLRQPIVFERQGLDFLYNCDDIPGFRGKWYLPYIEPMVPAINPGFMLLNPQAVDLDTLEQLVARYFISQKKYWWTRQAALSVLVGRSTRRGIFDGNDVRVISGNYKRTPQQVINNKWAWLGSNRLVTDENLMRQFFEGAAVLHCAGAGKKWLHIALDATQETRMLRGWPVRNATPIERVLISGRMLINRF
jgi:hypothetical protein